MLSMVQPEWIGLVVPAAIILLAIKGLRESHQQQQQIKDIEEEIEAENREQNLTTVATNT